MKVSDEQRIEYFLFASMVLGVFYRREDGDKVIANLDNDGRILAVSVYSHFTDTNCEMSIASDGSSRWMSKGFLRASYAYPFLQCGLQRVTGIIEVGNDSALRLDEHIGMVREGVLRNWFITDDGPKDGIVMGMLREECKWIR